MSTRAEEIMSQVRIQKKNLTYTISLLLLFIAATVRPLGSKQRAAGTANNTLSVEAGIVMKSGDVKPVARQEFYLLDRDPSGIPEIWDANVPTAQRSSGLQLVSLGLVLEIAKKACPTTDERLASACPQLEAFRKHTVASIITDFSGKGKFTGPARVYYLFSYVNIGNNQIAWSMKIDLTRGGQAIILDNRNAAGII